VKEFLAKHSIIAELVDILTCSSMRCLFYPVLGMIAIVLAITWYANGKTFEIKPRVIRVVIEKDSACVMNP